MMQFMGPHPRRGPEHMLWLGLLLLIVGASVVAGCSPRKTEPPSTASADTLANGLRRADASALLPWIELWREAIPHLEADSLRFGGVTPALRGGYIQPLKDFDSLASEEAAAFEVLTARSPGGRYRLVFDRYRIITEEDGAVDFAGEPDSAPLLLDERRGLAHQFESCGTPCGYDWGGWVDSSRFALGGWAEIDGVGDSVRGVVGIYSLAESTAARYSTRPVSRAEYSQYMAAWRNWATDRYRAGRSATAGRAH